MKNGTHPDANDFGRSPGFEGDLRLINSTETFTPEAGFPMDESRTGVSLANSRWVMNILWHVMGDLDIVLIVVRDGILLYPQSTIIVADNKSGDLGPLTDISGVSGDSTSQVNDWSVGQGMVCTV
jgi:hypothetical protein